MHSNPTSSNNRIAWIDTVKGIGIILVVLGHMPSLPEWIHNWIYSFHMPIFFFASGYLFKPRMLKECVLRSIKSLIVPYCIYSIVFFFMDFFIYHDCNVLKAEMCSFIIGQGSFEILWFFISMFWVQLIYNLIYTLSKNAVYRRLAILAITIMFYILTVFKIGILLKFSTSMVAMSFYAVGHEYRICNQRRKHTMAFGLILLLFNILACIVINLTHSDFLDINSQQYGILPLTWLCAICGCFSIVLLIKSFASRQLMKPINYMGHNSLYFFPLLAYIPVRLVDIMDNYVLVGPLFKVISKLIAFFLIYVFIEIKHLLNKRI